MLAVSFWISALLATEFLPVRGAQLRRGTKRADSAREGYFVYDYFHHGQDWTMGMCASRTRQSPIDFSGMYMNMPAGEPLYYRYMPVTSSFDLMNTGHAYSADLSGQGYGGITYDKVWYNLLYVNVHAESEHTLLGQHAPLEVHLVHKSHDSDAVLIVAVLVEASNPVNASTPPGRKLTDTALASDPNFNSALQAFLAADPPPPKTKVTVPPDGARPLDVNCLMRGGTLLEYKGSLTGPPCAETVTWLVRREKVLASDAQVQLLHDLVMQLTSESGNNRAVMPQNGREIIVRRAVLDDEPPPPVPEMVAGPAYGGTHSSLSSSLDWAQEALKVAKSSAEYVNSVDKKVQGVMKASTAAAKPTATQRDPYKCRRGKTAPRAAAGNFLQATTLQPGPHWFTTAAPPTGMPAAPVGAAVVGAGPAETSRVLGAAPFPGAPLPAMTSPVVPQVGTCHPQCMWQCESPKCDQVCEPVCQPPMCETRCKSGTSDTCGYKCDEPHCAVFCPQRLCPAQHCADCKTQCAEPICRLDCQKAECRNVCKQPHCDWHCRQPDDCPKPVCRMVCESPKNCSGQDTSYHEELPPPQAGETTVDYFRAPLHSHSMPAAAPPRETPSAEQEEAPCEDPCGPPPLDPVMEWESPCAAASSEAPPPSEPLPGAPASNETVQGSDADFAKEVAASVAKAASAAIASATQQIATEVNKAAMSAARVAADSVGPVG